MLPRGATLVGAKAFRPNCPAGFYSLTANLGLHCGLADKSLPIFTLAGAALSGMARTVPNKGGQILFWATRQQADRASSEGAVRPVGTRPVRDGALSEWNKSSGTDGWPLIDDATPNTCGLHHSSTPMLVRSDSEQWALPARSSGYS